MLNKIKNIFRRRSELTYLSRQNVFGKVETIEYPTQNPNDVLDLLEKGNLANLFQAYLMIHSDGTMTTRVLEVFKSLIGKFSIYKLDEYFRKSINHTDINYSFWCNQSPISIIEKYKFTEQDKIIYLGFSTFHSNGYYREKAMKKLMKLNTGEEMKFIVPRMNDWVKQISDLATIYCIHKISQKNIQTIYANMTYFLKIREYARYDYKNILKRLKNLFIDDLNDDYLYKGIKNIDPKVRLYFYNLLLEKNRYDVDKLIGYLKLEKNSHVKFLVLKKLFKKLTRDEIRDYFQHFINDKNSQIRSYILYTINELKIVNMENIVYPFIFDKSISVRQYARNILIKYNYDFLTIYRNELKKSYHVYTCIIALGELGNKEDLPSICLYLNHPSNKIVNASLKTITRLDLENNIDTILTYFQDEQFSISMTAFQIIKDNISYFNDKEIYDIYKTTKINHVRIFTVMLLTSFSKWISLKYILELINEEDSYDIHLCNKALVKWFNNVNKSFIHPKKQDIEDINIALNNNQYIFSKHFEDQLKTLRFILKDYIVI